MPKDCVLDVSALYCILYRFFELLWFVMTECYNVCVSCAAEQTVYIPHTAVRHARHVSVSIGPGAHRQRIGEAIEMGISAAWHYWLSECYYTAAGLSASPAQKLHMNTLISRNSSILREFASVDKDHDIHTCIWRFFDWCGPSPSLRLGPHHSKKRPSHWLLRDSGHTRSRSRRTTTTLVTVYTSVT